MSIFASFTRYSAAFFSPRAARRTPHAVLARRTACEHASPCAPHPRGVPRGIVAQGEPRASTPNGVLLTHAEYRVGSSHKANKRTLSEAYEELIFEAYEELIFEAYEELIFEAYEELIFEAYEELIFEAYEELTKNISVRASTRAH